MNQMFAEIPQSEQCSQCSLLALYKCMTHGKLCAACEFKHCRVKGGNQPMMLKHGCVHKPIIVKVRVNGTFGHLLGGYFGGAGFF